MSLIKEPLPPQTPEPVAIKKPTHVSRIPLWPLHVGLAMMGVGLRANRRLLLVMITAVVAIHCWKLRIRLAAKV